MLDQRAADLDRAVVHHRLRLVELGHIDRPHRRMTDVVEPDVDVGLQGLEIAVHDRLGRRRSVDAERPRETGVPREVGQRAELDVMVRMVVGDEDVADVLQLQATADELFARAVAAVDHVDPVADDDRVAGHVLRPADARPGARAEDVELGVAFGARQRHPRGGERCRGRNRTRSPQETAAVDCPVVTHVDYPSAVPPPGGGMVNPCSLGCRLIGGLAIVNRARGLQPRANPIKGPACAALAQLVEHRIRNAGVTGSSPVGGTSFD